MSEKIVSERIYISEEEYLEKYAAQHYEWVNGELIASSPATKGHYRLVLFLAMLFNIYFKYRPVGEAFGEPMVMKITKDSPNRQPDVFVVLNTNQSQFTDTTLLGAADICIEVVSKGTEDQDFGAKFTEYEEGGVGEYWIIDPIRRETRFHRLGANKLFAMTPPDTDGKYRTPLLPDCALPVALLWQSPLPDGVEIAELVQTMLKG